MLTVPPLQWGKTPAKRAVLSMTLTTSDGETPVLEIWELQIICIKSCYLKLYLPTKDYY